MYARRNAGVGCVGRCLGVCHFVGSWGMFGSRMFMLRVLDALRVFVVWVWIVLLLLSCLLVGRCCRVMECFY